MGRKPKIQCRIERDTDESIRAYRDELDDDISQSEAVRHLLRAGLAAEGFPVGSPTGDDHPFLEKLGSPRTVGIGLVMFAAAGLLLYPAAQLAQAGVSTTALAMLAVSTVLMLSGTATVWTAALAQMALARPLRALVLPWQAKA